MPTPAASGGPGSEAATLRTDERHGEHGGFRPPARRPPPPPPQLCGAHGKWRWLLKPKLGRSERAETGEEPLPAPLGQPLESQRSRRTDGHCRSPGQRGVPAIRLSHSGEGPLLGTDALAPDVAARR